MNVEEILAAVLRERADREVDADALLAGALAAGRARRRRNQRTMALAGAGVAGVTAATVLAVPLGGGGGGPTGDGTALGEPMPELPAAAGEPGLAERPDLVGADPNVLRFAVPWAPYPTTAVNWSSIDGLERLGVDMAVPGAGGDSQIWVTANIMAKRGSLPPAESDDPATANETTAVTVDGRPATIEREPASGSVASWLTWEPVDGVRMRITPGTTAVLREVVTEASPSTGPAFEEVPGLDDAQLVRFAESIRLDSTTRCTAPVQLAYLPDDARLTGCSSGTYFGRGEGTTFSTSFDFESRGGSRIGVFVQSPVFPSASPVEPRAVAVGHGPVGLGAVGVGAGGHDAVAHRLGAAGGGTGRIGRPAHSLRRPEGRDRLRPAAALRQRLGHGRLRPRRRAGRHRRRRGCRRRRRPDHLAGETGELTGDQGRPGLTRPACGSVSDAGLYDGLKGKVPELHVLGDAYAPRRLVFATRQAYALARELVALRT